MKPKMVEMFEVMTSKENIWFKLAKKYESKNMTDYCEPYLNIQKLLKSYHKATLKGQFDKATKIAHDLADETIRLEIASIKQLKNQWINNG